jgi:hypothetical protein
MNPPQTRPWRILRRCLTGLAVCVTLIGLFYTEENWRGKRDWDNCKRTLQAKGVDLNWADYIPAPVPDDQNVFGVPEMQKWFTGRGATELSKKLSYPAFPAGRDPRDTDYPNSSRTARLVVAELAIGLPEASAASSNGATVLHWGEERTRAEVGRLIKDAVGPVVMAPVGFNLTLRSPEEIRPAQILLQCQTAPTTNELLQLVPRPIANTTFPDSEKIQVEPNGDGSYKVTMLAPDTVAEYLKWSEGIEPEFALIRKALKRPAMRMNGEYSAPYEIPIPNFVTVRSIVQTLSAMAQCELLEGKPEEALRDLTLMHDLCRIMEGDRPMTLVAAMIDVAVNGLYAGTIADGLRWQGWREPQLAALDEQLKSINVLSPVKQSFDAERVADCHILETLSPAQVLELINSSNASCDAHSWKAREQSLLAKLIPRGWLYQVLVIGANPNPQSDFAGSLDPVRQIVFPNKAQAPSPQDDTTFSHWSPCNRLANYLATTAAPNLRKACQTTARNQTMVNQARIACALGRYHLAHDEYPETLNALVPQFIATIPHDVIGGQPPHYRRTADGTFILYSIGWDGRDNGGASRKTDAEGDWVWPES